MTVKLVLLKSGEEVISDMKEMAAGLDKDNQQIIGYVFEHPCRVKLYGNDVDTETVSNFQIDSANNNRASATITDAYKYYVMVLKLLLPIKL